MAFDPSLVTLVAESMAPLGTVTHRRMMGGATLYLDGVVFMIVSQDALWFKADKESDAAWDALGCARFTVEMNGRPATMNYRRAPDGVYDDPEELRRLGEMALAAGRRAPPRPASRRRPPRGNAGTSRRRS